MGQFFINTTRVNNFISKFLSLLVPVFGKLISINSFFVLLSLLLLFLAVKILIKLFLIKKQISETTVLLEVKPLRDTMQSAYSTTQLFTLIHSLGKKHSLLSRLVNTNKCRDFVVYATILRHFLK